MATMRLRALLSAVLCGFLVRASDSALLPKRDDASPVSVEVYYETYCPDCIDFIVNQLYPTYTNVSKIMNVTLVPYGNAKEKRVGDRWNFTCQHGPSECKGNLIQTCALHFLPDLSKSGKVLEFINCMELDKDPATAGAKCAKQAKVHYDPIVHCARGKQGNHLEHEMAQLTDNLSPKHTFVPWVVVNGVHNDDIQDKAQKDLLGLVCQTYQGPKPSGCPRRSKILHNSLRYPVHAS